MTGAGHPCLTLRRERKKMRGHSVLFVFGALCVVSGYELPPARLEAIYPKGLRVSIPGE